MCVRKFLVGVTAEYGPRASLPVLERLQRERKVELSVNDHDLAHTVGRRAAERFGVNLEAFTLCPNTFNYGCPHGYFEKVLGQAGTPEAAAGAICESLAGVTRRHGALLLLPRRRPRRDDGARPTTSTARSPPATPSETRPRRRAAGRASSWRTSTGPCAGRPARASSPRPGRWHRATGSRSATGTSASSTTPAGSCTCRRTTSRRLRIGCAGAGQDRRLCMQSRAHGHEPGLAGAAGRRRRGRRSVRSRGRSATVPGGVRGTASSPGSTTSATSTG